ncbi:hypothetical protein F4820DRAFT_191366 [Hypoxylon rubiginosum]|uniref:Uncharacterized protein n=1 Tax=Hypoxylon rubiginosum TaxID=110542 RepID=A0ACB9Z8P5_9PEZI|nr:hypothetical protein F4820DRAFT_191366 [Hypoxylon rubiginosum]
MASLKAQPSEPVAATTAAPPPPLSNNPPHDIPHPQAQAQAQSSQSKPQPQPQPQQQSQQQSQPHSQSSQSRSKPSEPSARDYYGYLFNRDKLPTPILDALLRAIGQYISSNIGDRNVSELSPKKLAAFYHAVGGDYDSLFITCPYKSISYIWQALGVQHTLQPTDNPFELPCIPALTLKGWVRWETIQLLLEPQEHVPFIQYAVRNWALVHPDTGRPFPADLPKEAFPADCDPEIDAWHKECARKLRDEATPKEEHPPRRPASDPRVHTTFSHARNPEANTTAPRSSRPEMDYFQRERPRERPVAYTHVAGSNYAGPQFSVNYSPGRRRVNTGNSGSSAGSNSSSSGSPGRPPRQRSHSDVHRHPPMEDRRTSVHLDPRRPPVTRRHSHTRPYSVSPSDSDVDVHPHPSSKSRPPGPIPPPSSVRRMPVATPVTPPVPIRTHRSEIRSDDVRRRSLPAEIKSRFTSFLSGSADRHRSNSREKRHVANVVPPPHFRRENPPSRLSRSVSGESYPPSDESDTEVVPRYPSRRDREHERVRERVIERERQREREREDELERSRRRERTYVRPPAQRRSNSHPDVEGGSRDYSWDRRDRGRGADYDRDGRRVLTSDERESRDRRRYKDRGRSPILTGVGGRRYPGESGWK